MEEIQTPRNLVAIMGTDAQEAESISRNLIEGNYRAVICNSLEDLKSALDATCMAAILDIDREPLDNRTIRALAHAHPTTSFLCISSERYHPDLQEAIRDHSFACLHKPVDPDELLYFLKCIRNDGTGSRGPPGGKA